MKYKILTIILVLLLLGGCETVSEGYNTKIIYDGTGRPTVIRSYCDDKVVCYNEGCVDMGMQDFIKYC